MSSHLLKFQPQAAKAGREKLIEQFLADGINFMFGNPGTVEEGFLDAMSDFPDMKYIETLQEGVAVGIADGYARTLHRPALVQLHSGVGLANGISLLYQAKRGHSPLIVLAGEAGLKYDAMDAQNYANLVDIARPVVKYATRVVDPESVLRTIRRAIKMAATPPMGPVFVALPLDVLDAECPEEVVPTELPDTRVTPDAEVISEAAAILVRAKTPQFIIGDGVAFSEAQPELVRLAHALGAIVYGADSSEPNYPADDPLWGGLLGHMWGTDSTPKTSTADVVLVVGTYLFPEVFPTLEGVFKPGAQVICVDLDAYEMGKNFPFTLGLLADPKRTLLALAKEVEARQDERSRKTAEERILQARKIAEQERSAQLQLDRGPASGPPLMARFSEELAERLHDRLDQTIVVDEAITNSPTLCRYLPPRIPGTYLQTRGGSLGIGLPGAVGAKLARPDRTVIGFAGDGGAMYTIQSLWTAAHHRVGAKFVVCNNRSYQILKDNIDHYWRERNITQRSHPSSFDIASPDLYFDRMAESMGVEAMRVSMTDEIGLALDRLLAEANQEKPFLIDLAVAH
jgi:benzoylformate decarboxylase